MIKKYIQFAIDNGYINREFHFGFLDELKTEEAKLGYILIHITSKEFIEAIARGYIKGWDYEKKPGFLNSTIYMITRQQAIAIRDNKLDDFIKEILDETY